MGLSDAIIGLTSMSDPAPTVLPLIISLCDWKLNGGPSGQYNSRSIRPSNGLCSMFRMSPYSSFMSTKLISRADRMLFPTPPYSNKLTYRMLNLLLGVGGSGTYHLLFHPHKPVNLHFSPTLWVSAAGLIIILLTTAVVVPLNGYLIDRRFAVCLMVAYGGLMVANIVVEIKTGRA